MSGAASALFILDVKGRVLLSRDYRGDVTSQQAERAFAKLMEGEVLVSFLFLLLFRNRATVFAVCCFCMKPN
jgi:hypothetical protein